MPLEVYVGGEVQVQSGDIPIQKTVLWPPVIGKVKTPPAYVETDPAGGVARLAIFLQGRWISSSALAQSSCSLDCFPADENGHKGLDGGMFVFVDDFCEHGPNC